MHQLTVEKRSDVNASSRYTWIPIFRNRNTLHGNNDHGRDKLSYDDGSHVDSAFSKHVVSVGHWMLRSV